jgi:hypothetical protein
MPSGMTLAYITWKIRKNNMNTVAKSVKKQNVVITGLDDYMKFRFKGCFAHYDCQIEFVDDCFEAFNKAMMLKNTPRKIDILIYCDMFHNWMSEWGQKLFPCSLWKMSIGNREINLDNLNTPGRTLMLKKDEILTSALCEKIGDLFQ